MSIFLDDNNDLFFNEQMNVLFEEKLNEGKINFAKEQDLLKIFPKAVKLFKDDNKDKKYNYNVDANICLKNYKASNLYNPLFKYKIKKINGCIVVYSISKLYKRTGIAPMLFICFMNQKGTYMFQSLNKYIKLAYEER